jgi:hypothetical protein
VVFALSDTETTAPAGEATEQQQATPKTFTQEEVDRIVGDRLARERKNYEGFDEFKAAAEKLPTLESERDEWKGKAEKFEAEKERAKLVSDIAEKFEVPAKALRGETEDDLKSHAAELQALLKPSGPVIPGQEKHPSKVEASEELQAARKLFGTD